MSPQDRDDPGTDAELTADLGAIDRVLRLVLGWVFVLAMGLALLRLGGLWRGVGALVIGSLLVLTVLTVAARVAEKG